jgi:hypothetical protein
MKIEVGEYYSILDYMQLAQGVEAVLGDKLEEDFELAIQVALVKSATQELQRMLDERVEEL